MSTSFTFTATDPNQLLITIYLIIITTTLLIFLQRRRFYKISRLFPGPVELPFIGIFHRICTPSDILPQMKAVLQTFQCSTIFTYFGPQPVLYTVDPALLEKIFTLPKLLNKPDILYIPLSNLFGDGLFTAPINKWTLHRKLVNPAFRVTVLRRFVPIFNRYTIDLKTRLDEMVDNGEHNLNELMQTLTLTTAVETVLGREPEPGYSVDRTIVQHYNSVTKSTIAMIILNVMKLSGLAKIFNFYNSRDYVYKFVEKLIVNRAEKNNKSNNNNNNNDEYNCNAADTDLYLNESRHIFIDQVLKQYDTQNMTWQDVKDQSNSVIFGAFDTTASTMNHALIFLAMHLDVQEKLFDEIITVFPERELEVVYEHLNQCTYLDMVINEVLRLAPAVPTIARGVVQDTIIDEKLTLPRGLVILINIYVLHRNPSLWGPNAEAFNPDNFLPENIAKRHIYSYMPFSKGLRNCIGGRYAIMALKVFLIHAIRNYRFTTKFSYTELEFVNHITLKLQKQPLLQVHRREI